MRLELWLCVLLTGCAASGVQVSEEQTRQFQVGRSTYGEVVGVLGEPTTSTVSANGTRVAVYSYASVQSRPQNFLPYIGPLVAGYDTKSSAVSFMFDARGVLTNSTSSQTNVGGGANLAAGVPASSGVGAQPR